MKTSQEQLSTFRRVFTETLRNKRAFLLAVCKMQNVFMPNFLNLEEGAIQSVSEDQLDRMMENLWNSFDDQGELKRRNETQHLNLQHINLQHKLPEGFNERDYFFHRAIEAVANKQSRLVPGATQNIIETPNMDASKGNIFQFSNGNLTFDYDVLKPFLTSDVLTENKDSLNLSEKDLKAIAFVEGHKNEMYRKLKIPILRYGAVYVAEKMKALPEIYSQKFVSEFQAKIDTQIFLKIINEKFLEQIENKKFDPAHLTQADDPELFKNVNEIIGMLVSAKDNALLDLMKQPHNKNALILCRHHMHNVLQDLEKELVTLKQETNLSIATQRFEAVLKDYFSQYEKLNLLKTNLSDAENHLQQKMGGHFMEDITEILLLTEGTNVLSDEERVTLINLNRSLRDIGLKGKEFSTIIIEDQDDYLLEDQENTLEEDLAYDEKIKVKQDSTTVQVRKEELTRILSKCKDYVQNRRLELGVNALKDSINELEAIPKGSVIQTIGLSICFIFAAEFDIDLSRILDKETQARFKIMQFKTSLGQKNESIMQTFKAALQQEKGGNTELNRDGPENPLIKRK